MARKAPRSEVGGGPAEPAGSLCVAEELGYGAYTGHPKTQTLQTADRADHADCADRTFFPLFFGEILTSRNTNIHKQDRRSPKT